MATQTLDNGTEGQTIDATTTAGGGDAGTVTAGTALGVYRAASAVRGAMGARFSGAAGVDSYCLNWTEPGALTFQCLTAVHIDSANPPTAAAFQYVQARNASAQAWAVQVGTNNVIAVVNRSGNAGATAGYGIALNGNVAPANGKYWVGVWGTVATATTGTLFAALYDEAGNQIDLQSKTNVDLGTANITTGRWGKIGVGPGGYLDLDLPGRWFTTAAAAPLPIPPEPKDTAAGSDAVRVDKGEGVADTAAATDAVSIVRTSDRQLADAAAGDDNVNTTGPGTARPLGPSDDLAVDLFNSLGTGVLGAPWTSHPTTTGTLTGDTGRVRPTSGLTVLLWHSGAAAFADGIVKADITYKSGSGYTTGVVGRLNETAATFYSARMNNSGGLELIKSVGGTITSLLSVTHNLAAGTSVKVQLRMQGSNLQVWANDVKRIDVTDTSITAAGRAGIRTTGGSSSTSGLHLDNWSARTLDVPMPTDVWPGYVADVSTDFTEGDVAEGGFYPYTTGAPDNDYGLFDPTSPGGALYGAVAKGKATGAVPNESLSDYDSSLTLSVQDAVLRQRTRWVSGRSKAGAWKMRYLNSPVDRNYAPRPRVRVRYRKSFTGTDPAGFGGIPLEVIGSATAWANGGGEWGLNEGGSTSPLGAWVRPANHLTNPNSYAAFFRADTAGVVDTDPTHWHVAEYNPANDDGSPGRCRILIDGVVIYDTNLTNGASDAPTMTDFYGILSQNGKPGSPSTDAEYLLEIDWWKTELPAANAALTANPADPAGATDQVRLTVTKAPADTAAVSDLPGPQVLDIDTDAADTVALSDSVLRALGEGPSDAAPVTDQVGNDRGRPVADAAAGADAVGWFAELRGDLTDDEYAFDQVDTELEQNLDPVDDPASVTDAVDWTVEKGATVADQAAGGDTWVYRSDRDRQPADLAGATDAAGQQAASQKGAADQAGATDAAGVGRGRTATDQAAGADAVTWAADGVQTFSDVATGTEQVTIGRGYGPLSEDAAAAGDQLQLDATNTAGDTATAADAVALVASADRAPADLAGVTDAVQLALSADGAQTAGDQAAATDAVAVFMARVVTVADFLGGVDAALAAWTLPRGGADPAGATDAASVLRTGDRSADDTAVATDAVLAALGGAYADQAAGGDLVALDKGETYGDLAGVSDGVLLTRGRVLTLEDVAAALDQADSAALSDFLLSDLGDATDTATYNLAPAEYTPRQLTATGTTRTRFAARKGG